MSLCRSQVPPKRRYFLPITRHLIPKECYLIGTLPMTVQVPEAGEIIGQIDVIGQAMEVSFCLCRTANHQRCHFVAFHTSDPTPEDTSKSKNFESRMLAVLLPTLPQTHLWYFCCSTEQAVFVQVIVFAESFEG